MFHTVASASRSWRRPPPTFCGHTCAAPLVVHANSQATKSLPSVSQLCTERGSISYGLARYEVAWDLWCWSSDEQIRPSVDGLQGSRALYPGVNLMHAHHTPSSEIAPLSTPWPANFLGNLRKVVCAQVAFPKFAFQIRQCMANVE